MVFFLIPFINASYPYCPDTNQIDVSLIPCIGVTVPISCADNVSIVDLNTSVQTNLTTYPIGGNQYNFTFNFTYGTYSAVDCQNNSATIVVGLFDQGYGIGLFGVIIPASIISFVLLFMSRRMARGMEKDEKVKSALGDTESGRNSRVLPTVFLLASFIPLIFLIRFVLAYLENYLPLIAATQLYSTFFIALEYLYGGIFIIFILIMLVELNNRNKLIKGLGDG